MKAGNLHLDMDWTQKSYLQAMQDYSRPSRDGRIDLDLRRVADEIGHRNPRWRGIDPRELEELVVTVHNIIGPLGDPVKEGRFEDLFHQAMAQLEIALEGEDDIEPDAAWLLGEWQKLLTQ